MGVRLAVALATAVLLERLPQGAGQRTCAGVDVTIRGSHNMQDLGSGEKGTSVQRWVHTMRARCTLCCTAFAKDKFKKHGAHTVQ